MKRWQMNLSMAFCGLTGIVIGMVIAVAIDSWYCHITNQRRLTEGLRHAVEGSARIGPCGRCTSYFFLGRKLVNRAELNFRGRNVDDAKLKYLAGAISVVGLDLSENPITDEGLRCVAEVPHLQWLQLSGTRITDEGLKHLRGLEHLRVLDLSDTRITQGAAQHLAEIKHLEAVYAWGTTLHTVQGAAVDANTKPSGSWIDGRTVWPLPLPQ